MKMIAAAVMLLIAATTATDTETDVCTEDWSRYADLIAKTNAYGTDEPIERCATKDAKHSSSTTYRCPSGSSPGPDGRCKVEKKDDMMDKMMMDKKMDDKCTGSKCVTSSFYKNFNKDDLSTVYRDPGYAGLDYHLKDNYGSDLYHELPYDYYYATGVEFKRGPQKVKRRRAPKPGPESQPEVKATRNNGRFYDWRDYEPHLYKDDPYAYCVWPKNTDHLDTPEYQALSALCKEELIWRLSLKDERRERFYAGFEFESLFA